MDYVLKRDLADEFHVNERQIERPAKELIEKRLIEKPSQNAARYRLSSELRMFFKKYEDKTIFSL